MSPVLTRGRKLSMFPKLMTTQSPFDLGWSKLRLLPALMAEYRKSGRQQTQLRPVSWLAFKLPLGCQDAPLGTPSCDRFAVLRHEGVRRRLKRVCDSAETQAYSGCGESTCCREL
jgi:hypothetical protein